MISGVSQAMAIKQSHTLHPTPLKQKTKTMNLFDVYPLNNITIVKGKGSYIWDDSGLQYLDLYGGHAVISIGHTHPHFVQRVTEQLNKLAFYSNSIKIPIQEDLGETF